VVASADTGVEWTHPALKPHYRGWNGVTASHDRNWHDSIAPNAVPLDDHNHGTHTTGTMVGDDGGVNRIGVAPGAQWIACRNMDHGVGTPGRYIECSEFGFLFVSLRGDPAIDAPGAGHHQQLLGLPSWRCNPTRSKESSTLRAAGSGGRVRGKPSPGAGSIGAPAIYDRLVLRWRDRCGRRHRGLQQPWSGHGRRLAPPEA
jgi:hypothetical protein